MWIIKWTNGFETMYPAVITMNLCFASFNTAKENIAKNEDRAFIANQPLPPLPGEAQKVRQH